LRFITFSTCYCITDQSIASCQEIFNSISVEDKLATPASLECSLFLHLLCFSIRECHEGSSPKSYQSSVWFSATCDSSPGSIPR